MPRVAPPGTRGDPSRFAHRTWAVRHEREICAQRKSPRAWLACHARNAFLPAPVSKYPIETIVAPFWVAYVVVEIELAIAFVPYNLAGMQLLDPT
jgi:hypothetical protein